MLGLGIAFASPTVAAAATRFGTPTASSTYGTGITFDQPATLDATIARAEVLLTFPGTFGPQVSEVDPPQASSGPTQLRYVLDTSNGSLLPNTPISARWRLTTTSGRVDVGPSVSVTYADTRFDWQTRTGSLVRIHWYQGSSDFGRRALDIAEQGVRHAEDLLGVTESKPIDFFVYADQQAFYDALGPGTRENVGGQANAEIRTLFALITPSELDAQWVGIVIPHELTHLVFNTAVQNPYHFPPRWLNEGLAVYLSQGYDASDRAAVRSAASSGDLIPLDGLTGQFPTTGDRFSLAYAESVSAIDFLIRGHGQDALVTLIRSYAQGRTDDEAFSAAIGQDTQQFDAAWFGDLGAAVPDKVGPQPAPAGPVPSGWGGSAAPGASASTGVAAPTARATATPAMQAPAPAGTTGDSDTVRLLAVVLGALAVVLAAAGVIGIRAARRRNARLIAQSRLQSLAQPRWEQHPTDLADSATSPSPWAPGPPPRPGPWPTPERPMDDERPAWGPPPDKAPPDEAPLDNPPADRPASPDDRG